MYVYVNWCDHIVIGENELNNLISEKAAELRRDTSEFVDWLNLIYDASDVWDNDEGWRDLVKQEWTDYCYEKAESEVLRNYEEYSIK